MTTALTPSVATGMWPALLGSLRGTVLEIGPGAGGNLRYYDPEVRWLGIEPAARHRELVRFEAARLGRRVQVLPGHAERLELADASVDAVVGSFVLCSVTDQVAVLAELHRVLRQHGSYLFAEHVAAPPGTWLRRGQHVWAAVTGTFGARCRLNRDSGPAIERAGFDIIDLHRDDLPGPLGAAIPHITGAAVRHTVSKGQNG